MPSLTKMLLTTVVLLAGLAQASPYGHHEQKPEDGTYPPYPPHTSGCGKQHSQDGGLKTVSIPTHDGPREFSIWIPPSYNKNNNTAVILSFHGSDMNSAEQAYLSGLNDSSVNPDMIAVFPQAVDCVWQGTLEKPVNDLKFVRQMLYYVQENYCVDNNRLYADGFNIGGGFVNNLACSQESGHYFAAYAMVSPAQYPDPTYPKHEKPQCNPVRPYPILELSFLGDEPGNYYDGNFDAEIELMHHYPGPDFIRKWAKRDGCDECPNRYYVEADQLNITSYTCHGTDGYVAGIKFGTELTGIEGDERAQRIVTGFFSAHTKIGS